MANIKKYTKKDGSTAYKFQAYLGTDPNTGNRIRVTRQGFSTKKAASLALSRLKLEVDEGSFIKANDDTFQAVYELWLEQYRNTVKESTLNKTIQLFGKHILPAFGSMKLDKISVSFCQKKVNEWFGIHTKYTVIKNYASSVLKFAIRMDLMKSNPMDKVTLPRRMTEVGKDESLKYFDKPELQRFFECSKLEAERTNNLLWHTLFRLLAFSGMRKGEALALTWNDLDFMNETVTINKTLTRGLENRLIIQTPKTASGKRSVALDPITLTMLNTWRKRQATDFLKLGFNTMRGEQLIFANTKNEFMCPTKPDKVLEKIIQRNDLKRITVHGFRHTHCSILFEAGASIKEVQDRLGHSDIKVTMNIYAHVTEKAKEKTAEKFAKYVNF
ncbi:tyrosine-type recombinase/integrase [uncultured Trichococcus sp.]|uniref:tyrosine-type recombinase/integrase n=1 Tax=uncultured Trichococcus sp. TaxID=189665 RepID=UPI002A18B40D|nr:tyrosine-type recombinase/integrase [uncultured Trichococcus sp.]